MVCFVWVRRSLVLSWPRRSKKHERMSKCWHRTCAACIDECCRNSFGQILRVTIFLSDQPNSPWSARKRFIETVAGGLELLSMVRSQCLWINVCHCPKSSCCSDPQLCLLVEGAGWRNGCGTFEFRFRCSLTFEVCPSPRCIL